jgi:hypothetical protein
VVWDHFGDPRPTKIFNYFTTREEAEAAHRAARAAEPDIRGVMCVTPTKQRKAQWQTDSVTLDLKWQTARCG